MSDVDGRVRGSRRIFRLLMFRFLQFSLLASLGLAMISTLDMVWGDHDWLRAVMWWAVFAANAATYIGDDWKAYREGER